MIRVDKSFYESGCTMEGKGNRIFLKGTDGNVNIQMTFVGDAVQIEGWLIPAVFAFDEIEAICVTHTTDGSFPDIKLKE